MPDAEYQIVTLKRAVARHGAVCRVRSDQGGVRVDIFWRPPRIKPSMQPFMSAMPLALMNDLIGKGFAALDEVPIDGLFQAGIVVASFANDAAEAATSACAVIADHRLTKSDRLVAWAPTPSERDSRVVSRHLADQTIEAAAR